MGRNHQKQYKNSHRSPSNHQHGKGSKKSNRYIENTHPSKRDYPHHQDKPAPQGKPRTILAFFDSELSKSKKSIKAFDVNTQILYNILRDNLVDEQGQPVDANLLKNGRLLKLTLDESGNAIKAKFTSESDISTSEESKETPGSKMKKGWEKKNEATTPGSEIEVRNGKVVSIGEKVEISCEGSDYTRRFNVDSFYFIREPNIGDEVRLTRKDGEILEVSFVKEGQMPARKAQAKSAWGHNSVSQAIKSELSHEEFPTLSSEQVQPNIPPPNQFQSVPHIPPPNPFHSVRHITPPANPTPRVDTPSSSHPSIYQKDASRLDSSSSNSYSDPRPSSMPQPLPPTFQTPLNPPPAKHAPQHSNLPNIPSISPPPFPAQITTLPSHDTSTVQQPIPYSAISQYITPTGFSSSSFNSTNPASSQYEPSTISTHYTTDQPSYRMPSPENLGINHSNPYSTPSSGPSLQIPSSNPSYPTQAQENPSSSHSNPHSSSISGPSSSYPIPATNNPASSQPNPYSSSISNPTLSSYPIPAPNNPASSQPNPYSSPSSGPSSQIPSSIAHLMPYNPEKSHNIASPSPPAAVSPVLAPLSPVVYIGDQKLAVDTLKSICPTDPHFVAKIESLRSSYESVRLLKKDGNSFYLALGVVYLEHLCSGLTLIPEFEYFIRRLDILYQDSTLSSVPDLIYFIESCNNLLRIEINFTSAVDPLQDYFKEDKFVRGMIIAIRNLSAKYLEMAFGDVRFRSMFRGNVIDRIRHYGVEADKEEYSAIAYAFGVSVRVVTIGQELKGEKYEPRDAYVSTMIDILNISGHHDILYTNQGH